MTGKRRRSQKSITDLARGQDCQIRIPGHCNGDPETTVPCHWRQIGLSGAGFIAPAILIAFGCSGCHQYCDSHHDDETQLAFARGIFRTQAWLLKQGHIQI